MLGISYLGTPNKDVLETYCISYWLIFKRSIIEAFSFIVN